MERIVRPNFSNIRLPENFRVRPNKPKQLLCGICFKKLIDPLRCIHCSTDFCSECCRKLNKCPVCDITPFKKMTPKDFDKLITALAIMKLQKLIRKKRAELDKNSECICSLCNAFYGTKEQFLTHLMFNHEEMALDIFNKRTVSDNKKTILAKIYDNVSSQIYK